MLLGFILVRYLMPFLKSPAKILFGMIKDILLQDSLITGFYMMLFSWMGSIITHFKATDEGCLRSSKDMKQFRADMKRRQEEMELEAEQDDENDDSQHFGSQGYVSKIRQLENDSHKSLEYADWVILTQIYPIPYRQATLKIVSQNTYFMCTYSLPSKS